MTYMDIKQRVYDILDMPIAEIVRIGYAGKIHRIFNEVTFRIAHSILPNLRLYTITLSVDKLPAKVTMPPDFISFADEQNAYVNGKNFVLTEFVDRSSVILNGNEGGFDETKTRTYNIYYNALYPEIVNGGLNYKSYILADATDTDAYTEVIQPVESPDSYIWPQIVGQLAPHYIVSQLLTTDDKVKSVTEMNNFETLLATVNVERKERQREYRSVRGWY